MNWVMILLMFDVHTGELRTHTEQLFQEQKQCEAAGQSHTVDVAPPEGLKASYICLPADMWLPPQPEPRRKRWGVF